MINRHIKRAMKIGMSGVEDSKEFAHTVSGIARMAAKAAMSEALALKIPVTGYSELYYTTIPRQSTPPFRAILHH